MHITAGSQPLDTRLQGRTQNIFCNLQKQTKSLLIISCLPTHKYQDIGPFSSAVGKGLQCLRGWALDHIVKEEIQCTAVSLNGKSELASRFQPT